MNICPVPGCQAEAPRGNIFCTDHYFRIPPIYTRAVNRISIECRRAETEANRVYLQEQLGGYIKTAIHHLSDEGRR